MLKFNPRYLVVSLGNPLPKYDGRHSVGHFALEGLAKALNYPQFGKQVVGKYTCLSSKGPKFTLVQSPTYMNISGGFVAALWNKNFRKNKDDRPLGLIIVHDEMESSFGIVKPTAWANSARGHNGVKDVKDAISSTKYPSSFFARIRIGIGRPVERDSATVSHYVLSPPSADQLQILREDTPSELQRVLGELEKQWERQFLEQQKEAHDGSSDGESGLP
jgi:PTH1 family peptidyl-tRNA hydrolase